jgi:hypothetical protein
MSTPHPSREEIQKHDFKKNIRRSNYASCKKQKD